VNEFPEENALLSKNPCRRSFSSSFYTLFPSILLFKLKTTISDGKCKLSKERENLRELLKKLDKENI